MGFLIVLLAIVLLIVVALAACSFAAWGATTAATGVALATGNLVNQVTIAILVIALATVILLMVWVAIRAFHWGRAVESRRSAEDLDDLQRQLEIARARSTHLPLQGAVLLLPPAMPPDSIHSQTRRETHRGRRVSRSARVALRTAKRWFQ